MQAMLVFMHPSRWQRCLRAAGLWRRAVCTGVAQGAGASDGVEDKQSGTTVLVCWMEDDDCERRVVLLDDIQHVRDAISHQDSGSSQHCDAVAVRGGGRSAGPGRDRAAVRRRAEEG